MNKQNDEIIVGSLQYGRLLKKFQKNILILLIVSAVFIELISVLNAILFTEKTVDKLLFLFLATVSCSILILIPAIELKNDCKNRKLIRLSVNDACFLTASSTVLNRDWNGSVKLSVNLHNKYGIINSKKYIKISTSFQNSTFSVLYNPKLNSVLFVKK